MILRDNTKKEEIQEEYTSNNKFNLKDFIFENKKLIIIASAIILVFIVFVLFFKNMNNDSTSTKNGLSIKLIGESTITVNTNSDFLDPGYVAKDSKEGDLTNNVQILGIIDISKAGTYTRYYTVENSRGTVVEIKRIIIVKNSSKEILTLSLKGNSTIEVLKGTKYIEPGYTAHDSNNNNLTSSVKVTNNLNSNVLGTYKITYTLTSNNNTKTVIRTVKVVDKKTDNVDVNINTDITVSNSNVTSGSVRITLKITGTGYDHTILPNQMNSRNKAIYYTVSTNGTYIFNVYDKNGGVKTVEKVINNIDNEEPTAICTGEIKNDNRTYLSVSASDNSNDQLSYMYKSGTTRTTKLITKTYIINSRTKTATVTVYDKAGNYVTAVCSIFGDINMIYPQIKPSSGIVSEYSSESDTLKVNTVKKSGYYLVYIWAKNPYMQFHVQSAKMNGETHDTIAGLFKGALNKNGVRSKIAVAVNSDPSVYYGSYYFCRSSGCPFKSYTSGGLVVREGTTYRYDTTTNGKRVLTYTVTRDNQMIVLTDKYNFSNPQARIDAYKPAIIGQARNTAVALHIIMYNGELLSKKYNPYKFGQLYEKGSNSVSTRNGLCQIDGNNFVYLISNTSKTEDFMAGVFNNLGCQVAVSNDGGGSTNFWFKKASSGSWNSAVGSGSRGRMDSIVYWTEL